MSFDKNSSYEEAHNLIEELVSIKKRKYARGHLSPEDIAQEVRLKCWASLEKFDPTMGKTLKTFLNVITERSLLNLIRDNFGTFNPPNKKNPEFFKNGKPTKKALQDEKTVAYMERFNQKRQVRFPADIEIATPSSLLRAQSSVDATDMDLSIRDRLRRQSAVLVHFYDNLLEGKEVPKYVLVQIQTITRELIEELK